MKTKFYFAAIMLLLSVNLFAAEVIDSGKCGDNLTYTLTDDGVLTISGTGDMNDYIYFNSPWSTWTDYIETIIIQSGVTSIGNYAFYDCSSLTSITIPNSVTSIGHEAFRGCSSLTSITIPNSVTSIRDWAFYDCSSLTSITIPNSVTNIGYNPFSGCSGLISIIINNNPIYDSRNNCNAIIETATNELISACVNTIIPNSVTSIGGDAFAGCSSLTSITIPNSITSIGDWAFYDCSSLTSITIPNGVTSIGHSIFYDCSSLTSITIPNSVTSIGDYAFAGCESLTGITIPNSVTSIGDWAFSGCSSLTSITIPNSVTSISWYMFDACKNLEIVVLGSGIQEIGFTAFHGCERITDIYCYAELVPYISTGEHGWFFNPFQDVSCKMTVWVPSDRLRNYQIDPFWSEFDVQPMAAESANTDQVVVSPDNNSADVIWPAVGNANTYELIIRDKDGNEICSLIFNSNGQLQSIAFRAPAVDREHAPQQTQASGFRFTITGLDSGSQYSYTITAKDAAGKALQTYTGTFYTLSATGVDNLDQDGGTSAVRKVIEDGQVKIIMPDGKKLNMQGAEVR